jgi:MoxR-like ATPase
MSSLESLEPLAKEPSDAELLERTADAAKRLRTAVAGAVVGQDSVVELMLVTLAARGHALLVGVPGLAKTLLVASLARALDLSFGRVQFTPDLLPADITGTDVLHEHDGARSLRFQAGPIFHNLVLADEINRTPPKTQAALLEAMQEGQVTVDGESRPLPAPFLVAATQNPIEYEGTYPLPEAQLDRFLFRIDVGYPDAAGDAAILRLAHRGVRAPSLDRIEAVASAADLAAAGTVIDETTVSDEVAAYLSALVRMTRELPAVELGASPRAAVHLLAASRAAARLAGRAFVTPDDVVAMATPVLAHRLVLRPEAELERVTPQAAVAAAIAAVAVPR